MIVERFRRHKNKKIEGLALDYLDMLITNNREIKVQDIIIEHTISNYCITIDCIQSFEDNYVDKKENTILSDSFRNKFNKTLYVLLFLLIKEHAIR